MVKFNYYQQRRRKIGKRFITSFFIFLSFYLLGGLLLSSLSSSASLIFRPLWWSGEAISSTVFGVVDFFRDHNKLVVENRQLQRENNELKTKLLAKDRLVLENDSLRKSCGRVTEKSSPLLGRIIFLPNFVPYQTLLVDIGSSNTSKVLRVGDLAVSLGDVLIGRVVEVNRWSSKIKLISAEKEIAVTVGASKIPAVATGSGAGNFSVVLPKSTPVKIGDAVRASLYNDLLIGTVRYAEKIPSRPNQTILVNVPVNLWQLEWLKFYDIQI